MAFWDRKKESERKERHEKVLQCGKHDFVLIDQCVTFTNFGDRCVTEYYECAKCGLVIQR